MSPLPNIASMGDVLPNEVIQFRKIDTLFRKLYGQHAAADIHPYYIGDNLVRDSHCGSDRTALSSMDIGHDPNPTPRRKGLITEGPDLFRRRGLQRIGKYDRLTIGSL